MSTQEVMYNICTPSPELGGLEGWKFTLDTN